MGWMNDDRKRRSSHEDRRYIAGRRSIGTDLSGGRRRTDRLPKTTITAKVVAALVFLINLLYLVVEALISGCQPLV